MLQHHGLAGFSLWTGAALTAALIAYLDTPADPLASSNAMANLQEPAPAMAQANTAGIASTEPAPAPPSQIQRTSQDTTARASMMLLVAQAEGPNTWFYGSDAQAVVQSNMAYPVESRLGIGTGQYVRHADVRITAGSQRPPMLLVAEASPPPIQSQADTSSTENKTDTASENVGFVALPEAKTGTPPTVKAVVPAESEAVSPPAAKPFVPAETKGVDATDKTRALTAANDDTPVVAETKIAAPTERASEAKPAQAVADIAEAARIPAESPAVTAAAESKVTTPAEAPAVIKSAEGKDASAAADASPLAPVADSAAMSITKDVNPVVSETENKATVPVSEAKPVMGESTVAATAESAPATPPAQTKPVTTVTAAQQSSVAATEAKPVPTVVESKTAAPAEITPAAPSDEKQSIAAVPASKTVTPPEAKPAAPGPATKTAAIQMPAAQNKKADLGRGVVPMPPTRPTLSGTGATVAAVVPADQRPSQRANASARTKGNSPAPITAAAPASAAHNNAGRPTARSRSAAAETRVAEARPEGAGPNSWCPLSVCGPEFILLGIGF